MTSEDIVALTLAVQAGVPAAMRERQQWLLWRFEVHEADEKAGKTKPRKVPYYVSGRKRRGVQGSDADRRELATFDIALTHLTQGRFSGIGFAFLPGDGLVGIDIDKAIDGDGQVSERCQAIIEASGSYTELSPSGTGVHIICAGETESFKDNSIGVEVFCGRQYFTVTGRHWAGTPDQVQPLQEKTLRRLRATVKGQRRGGSAPPPPPGAPPPGGIEPHVSRYVLAALVSAEQRMRGAAEGGRNDRLNEEAFGLAQLLHTGVISETTIRATLGEAARGAGLDEREIAATLNSAIRAGQDDPRTVPKPRGRARDDGISTPSRGSAGDTEQAAAAPAPPGPPAPPAPPADDGPPPEDDPRVWRRRLVPSSGGIKDCRENVFMFLHNHPALQGLVGYDEFAHRVMKLRDPPWDSSAGEWSTNDDYLLGFWLAQRERLVIKSEATLMAGVAMAAYANRYNPLLDYLHGLPAWDGKERLRYWLSECLGATESDYTHLVGAWFLMGMVKRALDPGCQMDYTVVLEGLQGKRKSTALRVLTVRDDWFADTPVRIGDKDSLLNLAGKWLYEIGELDSFNKAEVTAVKQYISSRTDRVREPFAKRPADRKRSCVFGCSTNQSEYFKDPTGARRFWPVACDNEIDLEKLIEWRDQLYAECMQRLASDDEELRRYYPTRAETEKFLVPQQEKREIVDPWFERLAVWLQSKQQYGDTTDEIRSVQSFTSYELLTKALNVPLDRIDGGRQMATRVGIAMHRMGWEKRRDSDGARVWRYWRPKPEAAAKPAAGDEVLHEF